MRRAGRRRRPTASAASASRVPPVDHPAFEADGRHRGARAGARLAYLMMPKPRGLADVQRAVRAIDAASRAAGLAQPIPLHALVETHGALREVQALAAHPRIESLSFGLMDFVSAHRGAIPASAMSAERPVRAPAGACAPSWRSPPPAMPSPRRRRTAWSPSSRTEARCRPPPTRPARELGYTRMWSIHPAQIRAIVDAFAPSTAEVDQAIEIMLAAQAADWAPIRHRDTLHDRASYRYFWQVLRARAPHLVCRRRAAAGRGRPGLLRRRRPAEAPARRYALRSMYN